MTAAVASASHSRRYREESVAFDDFVATIHEGAPNKRGIDFSDSRAEKNVAIGNWADLPREGMQATRFPTPRPVVEEAKKEKKPKRQGPVRVLVLHGICSSAAVMKKQLARLQVHLKGRIELVYIDGKIQANEETPGYTEMIKAFKNMDFYDFATMATKADTPEAQALREVYPDPGAFAQYLISNPDERVRIAAFRKYNDTEGALQYIEDKMKELAPIDGVLGFGAGANFAGMLACKAHAGLMPKFDFAVILCPGKPGYCEELPDLYKEKSTIRSLHISGNTDFVNPPHCLADHFVDPELEMHNDSARPIPGTNAEEANMIANRIIEFILGDDAWDS